MQWIGLGAAAALALGVGISGATAHAATPACAALTGLQLPHAKVTAASDETAGKLPACKIEVTATPTPDSDIRIEVWIPDGDSWNGRYLQLGNGGFAGAIRSPALQTAAANGYAVAATD